MRTQIITGIALCLVATIPMFGQFESGAVVGTVTDPGNSVVSEASVTLLNKTTGATLTTRTDREGNYQFVNQRQGGYTIRVQAAGFQISETDQFELTVAARQRVDISLHIGPASESITVTDAAAALESETSARGQVVRSEQIVQLPLNGRAYSDLTLLVPGVAKSQLENQSNTSREGSFNVNGMRASLNNFLLDGVDNNSYATSSQGFSNQVIQANPDALAEFRIETSNFSAEFGKAAGAVINATLRSGSNDFRGQIWEFNRNAAFNAVGFFRPSTSGKPAFNQNQFGGAFGGPIRKDKSFFFADYEGFRRVTHATLFATVPTAAQKAGILGIPVRNPLTGAVYSEGVIPASAISPFAAAVLAALPDPNNPNAAGVANSNNLVSAPSDRMENDKGDIRYDRYFGTSVTVFGRYSQASTRIYTPASISGPAGGNANGDTYARNYQGVGGVTWTLGPASILEARLGITYTAGGKFAIGTGSPVGAFGVPNLPTNPDLSGGLYSLNLGGGLSALGRQSATPQFQNPLVIDPKINYTRILRRHSLKLGFEYMAINTDVEDFHPKYGLDQYTGYYSNPTYPTLPATANGRSVSTAYAQQLYSLADLMFGARNHYEINNDAIAHLRQRMYFGYVQDDFKATTRLTLNLGLRYEFATPQWERDNHLSNFDPILKTLVFASGGSIYNRALVHPQPNNWAPRIGLAYSLTPRTVIRSAYGISYVQFNRYGGENLLVYNGPFVVDALVDGQSPLTQPLCTNVADAPGACFRPTSLGFPNNFASAGAFNTANNLVRYIPADNPTGYVQNWHFTIQRELAKNLVLDLAYVGNHSVGLLILGDANQAVPNVLGQNLSVNARRPIPGFASIQEAFGGGFGSYNALQVKLEKRMSRGVYFLNSFTWGKAIDNAAGQLEIFNGDVSRINLANSKAQRALSGYDQKFNDTLSLLYDIPVGRGRKVNLTNRTLDLIAGGWGLNLINTAVSGAPLNIVYSPSAQAQVTTLSIGPRPNLLSSQILTPEDQRTVNTYFNAAAFALPSYTQPFGNAGRNVARSFPLYQLDFGLHKNFRLGSETRYVQFRAEAFNLFNRTNFSPPGTTFGSSSFGVVSSTFPARQIQFGAKFYF
jgi:Carboxypeptidase regulatory-like domain/TonB-dependent Receptor Plug Domain